MDIIAIKGVRIESLNRFLKDWWHLRGMVMKARGWLFIFVTGTDYFGTVNDYASLISTEMDKLVIYINGKSGVIDQFVIYEQGILCPASEEQAARRPGKSRTHESWFIKNRLAFWGMREENREQIRALLGGPDDAAVDTIIRLPMSNATLNQLAGRLFDSWRLPIVWSAENVEAVAKDENVIPI